MVLVLDVGCRARSWLDVSGRRHRCGVALAVRGLQRLELGHRANNPASGAIARHAGFVKEGTERAKFLLDGRRVDVDTYGRLASDPPPRFVAVPMVGGGEADAYP